MLTIIMTNVYLLCIFIYLFIPIYIYLSLRNALPMIDASESSQGIILFSYILIFYHSPLKHLFCYYYTIFKLILFQYDISLSKFRGIIDQCG